MPKITVKCGYWVQPQSSYYIILAVGMLTVARVGLTICSNPERQGAGGCRRPRWGPGATSLGGVRGQSPLMGPGVKALWWGLGATPLGEGQGSKPLGRGQGSKPLGGGQGSKPLGGVRGQSPLVGQGSKPLGGSQGSKHPEADKSLTQGKNHPQDALNFMLHFPSVYTHYSLSTVPKSKSHLYSCCLHTLSHTEWENVLKNKNCQISKFGNIKTGQNLTFKAKVKLLVQLKVTLTIKTIKICRPRARFELAISVLHLDQGFQD